jgi:hypothetical protein
VPRCSPVPSSSSSSSCRSLRAHVIRRNDRLGRSLLLFSRGVLHCWLLDPFQTQQSFVPAAATVTSCRPPVAPFSRQWGRCSRICTGLLEDDAVVVAAARSPVPTRGAKRTTDGRRAERRKERRKQQHYLGRRASYGDAGRAGSSCRECRYGSEPTTGQQRCGTGKACFGVCGTRRAVWGQCAQGPTRDNKDVPTDACVGVLLLAGRWVGAWSLVSQHGRPRPRGGGRVSCPAHRRNHTTLGDGTHDVATVGPIRQDGTDRRRPLGRMGA